MTAQYKYISSPSPISRNHAFRSTRYFSLASGQKFDHSERDTAPGHRKMATYASSAPATDSPDKELDEFPTVAKVAKKVKMNPLAALYDPALLGNVTRTASSTSQDDAKTPASHSILSDADNIESGSGHGSYDSTKTRLDFQQKRDLAQLPTRSSTAPSISQTNIMSHVLHQRDLPPHQPCAIGQSNLELACYAPRNRQQTVLGERSGYTLSQHGMHQYTDHASAPVFHPNAMQPPPFWFQVQLLQPFAPLPPSYPYPHIDPFQLDSSPSIPRRRDRPYDNTALATHYLSTFTELYGTSPTSLDSLQKICITLGYTDHASHTNGFHASRNSTPAQTYSTQQNTYSTSGHHNRKIRRSGRSGNHNAQASSSIGPRHTQNTSTDFHPYTPPSTALPETIRKAQTYIKSRYVNIFDLVDAGSRGEAVVHELVFRSAAELRAYSEETRKICPAEVGRGVDRWRGRSGAKRAGEASGGESRVLEDGPGGNELWRWMLRKWY